MAPTFPASTVLASAVAAAIEAARRVTPSQILLAIEMFTIGALAAAVFVGVPR
ncbi:hypothetical protein [Roseomonas gilardii]|uniref:hypothetical protein n=1 Tax=Roseomonas gilardii TaxID=257708 RepID=UPI0012EC2632|nr:hypothetical protein [Roseomonas gilardii]